MREWRTRLLVTAVLLLLFIRHGDAQDNYEIQVYPSETIQASATMVELHSNYTLRGSTGETSGVVPDESSLHETLELTHGFTPWLEVGFYFFTSLHSGYGWKWAGDHVRPRIRVPESWSWPVGVSLSMEVGYARPEYTSDPWSLEIRPIIDKQSGGWYVSFNPAADLAFSGSDAGRGFDFTPAAKVSYTLTPLLGLGCEYYASLRDNQHQIVPAVDLDLAPGWEFNAGFCLGVTPATDRSIVKVILGRQLGP